MRVLSLALQGAAAGTLIGGAWVLLGVGGALIALALPLAIVGAVLERGVR